MDLKKYGQRPYILFSLVGTLTFGVLWLACILYDPSWDPAQNSISDLSMPPTAPIFATACILTGILLALYGIGKVIYDDMPGWVAGIAMVLGSVGLCAMGMFNKEFYDIHFLTAAIAVAFYGVSIGLTIIGHFIKKRHTFGAVELIICLIACIGFPLSFGRAQSLALFCVFLWVVAELVFYKKQGCLD